MKKELYFGVAIMAMILIGVAIAMPAPSEMTDGHLGLLMLSLVVVAIMLGFPTAFTLMGMGVIFTYFAYDGNIQKTLDLMVQSTYKVMTNDVLISVPLFVFMGYLVERANLIEKLFKSLHLAMARLPGALGVATLVTCAIFATATGIVGAVVTLMGLLAMPSMLKAGYDTKMAAGAITAGGCLGILIPPSVLLIVYGATAGVSVVQLYAGALFPGLMLTTMYIAYIIIRAKINPKSAPPLSEEERRVPLSPVLDSLKRTYGSSRAVSALVNGLKGRREGNLTGGQVAGQLFVAMIPAIFAAFILGLVYSSLTAPKEAAFDTSGLVSFGSGYESSGSSNYDFGLEEPAGAETTEAAAAPALEEPVAEEATAEAESTPAPTTFWIWLMAIVAVLGYYYSRLSFERLEVFKMLLTSFFPLAILIGAVLGSIVMGLATPSEAAALGAFGGLLLAAGYRQLSFPVLRESAFLTSKTTAMVCWLFVGSSIFSAAFALLGGQELVETWVLSLGLTPIEFLLLSQVIIFLLGWPLEWTEIIVIFMPIFIPLLPYFDVDPLFFGLLVALNLQTAFLSPPVAMAAFYLKGVSPPGVTLNQIFMGMIPFMFIQIFAMFVLYVFPQIGMWLPSVLYR
ncbi:MULTISPECIES: TRAP transporter large permease subunit [unclassified Limnobacter]|uniref:TRAP transporter large permease n=1 Tax=unclassified Limnobacter TaxID=2630203 RepID=UPI000C5CB219|nr:MULTISPECIES: TRAP transporter large permease subunit [unclassified Limnobacter]MAZ09504.1 C4-dicarboxylate ABC transporter [Sutterellaceae bacterium]|tara:strand:+ start:16223 stop:18097 length:1875 start_codon:yes stop_codon:yes gene_type:complete